MKGATIILANGVYRFLALPRVDNSLAGVMHWYCMNLLLVMKDDPKHLQLCMQGKRLQRNRGHLHSFKDRNSRSNKISFYSR